MFAEDIFNPACRIIAVWTWGGKQKLTESTSPIS